MMTTTGTFRPPAAAVLVPLVLLAASILAGPAAPLALADVPDALAAGGSSPVLVPEPATLLFVSVAGLVLFGRRRRGRLR
ncbi:MAG: PEP-CTERM sorting domain-containing protein [Phycisphaerae bacterium]|nr:PEP-CTERM sorting domain-containing protein [Phycisphaerae bacterium]